jgi:hypothetical protein
LISHPFSAFSSVIPSQMYGSKIYFRSYAVQ